MNLSICVRGVAANQQLDENIIINEKDGLPNVHPNLESSLGDARRRDSTSSGDHTDNELEDLPTSLIVTNIQDAVFASEERKREMEELFRQFGDEQITFQWLRSFRRLRVNFQTPTAAASARVQLHQYKINESVINCYFAQPVTPVKFTNLRPPAPDKQFLISPPASPPLDWEPRPENEPLVNHDLLAALATLAPGGSHELHPAAPGQPGIVVHAAGIGVTDDKQKPRIAHTRCPEHPL
ncbi:sarah [Carabus blaptoides fortunei]